MSFDWYQASVQASQVGSREVVMWARGLGDEVREAPGLARMYRYGEAWRVYRDGVGPLCTVLGSADHGGSHVIASGEHAEPFARVFRSRFPEHQVTRADVAYDFFGGADYDRDRARLRVIAEAHRVSFPQIADELDEGAGRTQYLGSPRSSARVRFYEKGLEVQGAMRRQIAGGVPVTLVTEDGEIVEPSEWLRLECQVRPEKGEARQRLASAEPREFWGCSPVLRAVFQEFFGGEVETCSIQVKRGKSEAEKALLLLCLQYGRHLGRLLEGAGSDEAFGRLIREQLEVIAFAKRTGMVAV